MALRFGEGEGEGEGKGGKGGGLSRGSRSRSGLPARVLFVPVLEASAALGQRPALEPLLEQCGVPSTLTLTPTPTLALTLTLTLTLTITLIHFPSCPKKSDTNSILHSISEKNQTNQISQINKMNRMGQNEPRQ